MVSERANLDKSIRTGSNDPKWLRQSLSTFASDEGEVRYPADVRWVCVGCGNSCGDLPGRRRSVLLAPHDVERIADATELTPKEFSVVARRSAPYTRKMKKRNGKCIFFHSSRCSIYGARPLICRFYPFCIRPLGTTMFEIGVDLSCMGIGTGPRRDETFFRRLVELAKAELSTK